MTDVAGAIRQQMAKAIADDFMALFCLGQRGEHFEPEEWDRRKAALIADPHAYLHGEKRP